MVRVPGATFAMGCEQCYAEEAPAALSRTIRTRTRSCACPARWWFGAQTSLRCVVRDASDPATNRPTGWTPAWAAAEEWTVAGIQGDWAAVFPDW